MKNILRWVFFCFLGTIFIVSFRFWLPPDLMYGGDFYFPPFPKEQQLETNLFAWDEQKAAGLGGRTTTTLWVDSYQQILPNRLLALGFPAWIVQKSVFQLPLVVLLFASQFLLVRFLFPSLGYFALISSLVYGINTYSLLVINGGQMGIALGYAVAPLVFLIVVRYLRSKTVRAAGGVRGGIVLGIAIAAQMWMDIRIVYITALGVVMYVASWVWLSAGNNFLSGKRILIHFLFLFGGIVTAVWLHAFWIVPILSDRANQVSQFGVAYTSDTAVQYFSFADFPHAFSLLHANWPENIFGKTYFLQPEFLILPILAFGSLLFVNRKRKEEFQTITSFCLLGLVGIFLAKGSNPPFGGLYVWLFTHFPGFVMFRDASKLYLLGALSYAVLIPFTLWHIDTVLERRIPRYKRGLTGIFFVVLWAFLIRQALFGGLHGLLTKTVVTEDYQRLQQFLTQDKDFGRTFAVPAPHRFFFFSPTHPVMEGQAILEAASPLAVVTWLESNVAQEQMQRWSVSYVVVPFDTEGELFVKDRVYDADAYSKAAARIRRIPWLTEETCCGRNLVFRVSKPYGRFWAEYELESEKVPVSYESESPVEYRIDRFSPDSGILVFSESYDPGWVLETKDGDTIHSARTSDGLNSFPIEWRGPFVVRYEPQRYVVIGTWISMSALTVVFVAGVLNLVRRYRRLPI